MSKSNTVASFLTQQLALCGKTQFEVSLEIGYQNTNMMTMLKQGRTKLPIEKIPRLAAALGVDPIYVLRTAMNEYMPSAWHTIENVLGTDFNLSNQERLILQFIREVENGRPVLPNSNEKKDLQEMVQNWYVRQSKEYASQLRVIELH